MPRSGFGRCTPGSNAVLFEIRVACGADGRGAAAVSSEVFTIFALVGGNPGGSGCHSDVGLRLAAAWLKNRISTGLRTGNPDTLASAASRCVDGVVFLARVACGEGRGRGETNTVHLGITGRILERVYSPTMKPNGPASSLLDT
jgi:hypothetical protein